MLNIMLTLLHCVQHYAHLQCKKAIIKQLGTRRLCFSFYLLCYIMLCCAVLKNFAYYAQIMLNIYASVPMFCYTLWIDNKWLKPCHRKDRHTLIEQSAT